MKIIPVFELQLGGEKGLNPKFYPPRQGKYMAYRKDANMLVLSRTSFKNRGHFQMIKLKNFRSYRIYTGWPENFVIGVIHFHKSKFRFAFVWQMMYKFVNSNVHKRHLNFFSSFTDFAETVWLWSALCKICQAGSEFLNILCTN